MVRFCIICQDFFGCVSKGRGHVCDDCSTDRVCQLKDNNPESSITSGICEDCWEKKVSLKKAVNY